MLILRDLKCGLCKQKCQGIIQHSEFHCKQCDKKFTLCPNCATNFVCDCCGCSEKLDVYEYFKKTHGTDVMF